MRLIFTSLHFVIALSLFTSHSFAQLNCDNNRYREEIFSSVVEIKNIPYGQNETATGQNQSLLLDVYMPQGDQLAQRPLIVFAHGGSFVSGSKESADIVEMCRKYAKMGYVTASIAYRLGFGEFIPNADLATKAVVRATHDMKAAIRFFRKDAATTNEYKIHPDYIISAGVSAGAFMALHAAYMNEESELPDWTDLTGFGGVEGTSGNAGYSSGVRGVVNLCGAIGDTSWIKQGEVPCVSMHGTTDNVVPYGTAVINVFTFIALFEVDGSASVTNRLNNLGIRNAFKSWEGIGHTPFIGNAAYMDSVFQFVTPFMADELICNESLSASSINNTSTFSTYPNPFSGVITFKAETKIQQIFISDLSGRVVFKQKWDVNSNTQQLDLNFLEEGIYIATVETEKGLNAQRIINRK